MPLLPFQSPTPTGWRHVLETDRIASQLSDWPSRVRGWREAVVISALARRPRKPKPSRTYSEARPNSIPADPFQLALGLVLPRGHRLAKTKRRHPRPKHLL